MLHRDIRRDGGGEMNAGGGAVVTSGKNRRGRRERRRGAALLLVLVLGIRRHVMDPSDAGKSVVGVEAGELRHHRMVTRRNGAVAQVVYRVRILKYKSM